MKTFNANSFHIILVVSLFFCSCSNGLLNTTLNPSGGENGLKTWSVSENSSAGFCDTVEGRSGFRCINRRNLRQCLDLNPYLEINVGTQGPLKDEENVTVTVSGVLHPSDRDWVALISPSTASISDCPQSAILYKQTGDIKSSPLLCHYPVKADEMNRLMRLISQQECDMIDLRETKIRTISELQLMDRLYHENRRALEALVQCIRDSDPSLCFGTKKMKTDENKPLSICRNSEANKKVKITCPHDLRLDEESNDMDQIAMGEDDNIKLDLTLSIRGVHPD